ncbi:MAG: hypothetical protein RL266_1661 [Bacteroidota bacterium]
MVSTTKKFPCHIKECQEIITTAEIAIGLHSVKRNLWIEVLSGSSLEIDTLDALHTAYLQARNGVFTGPVLNPTYVDLFVLEKFRISNREKNGLFGIRESEKHALSFYLEQVSIEQDTLSIDFEQWFKGLSLSQKTAFSEAERIQRVYTGLIEEALDEVYGNSIAGCFPRFINLTRYCGGSQSCKESVYKLLDPYIQDKLYGLKRMDTTSYYALNDPQFVYPNSPTTAAMRALKCSCLPNYTGLSLGMDIPGGNILVGDRFVLIGRDELEHRFLRRGVDNVTARLNYMEIDTTLPDSIIRSKASLWLKENVFDGKEVIWVGTDSAQMRFHTNLDLPNGSNTQGHSPFYHIDLFISLLGKHPEFGDSVLYVLGKPNLDYQKLAGLSSTEQKAYREVVYSIGKHIDKTVQKMEQDLISVCNVKLKRIEVPLPIDLNLNKPKKEWLGKAYSFVNGQVENIKGEITFYAPFHTVISNNVLHQAAYDTFETKLQTMDIEVHKVEGEYPKLSGLHCTSVVLSREY